MLAQPSVRGANHARLFSRVDRQFGRAVAPGSACLHLDKHHQRSASRNQVDLDTSVADVSSIDAIPSRHEERGGARFAERTELVSWGYPRGFDSRSVAGCFFRLG